MTKYKFLDPKSARFCPLKKCQICDLECLSVQYCVPDSVWSAQRGKLLRGSRPPRGTPAQRGERPPPCGEKVDPFCNIACFGLGEKKTFHLHWGTFHLQEVASCGDMISYDVCFMLWLSFCHLWMTPACFEYERLRLSIPFFML